MGGGRHSAMGDVLRNSPLVEAVCEFRFSAESPWDWTIPGRLYDAIKQDFPLRSEIRQFELIQQGVSTEAERSVQASVPDRMQLKREDNSGIVQIGPRLLSINLLKPYPGWEVFLVLILDVLDKYSKIAGINLPDRIGLRYINHIPFPGGDPDLYLKTLPVGIVANKASLKSFFQRFDLSFASDNGTLVHQTGSFEIEGARYLALDLDFSCQRADLDMLGGDTRKWLETAHERIEWAFRGALTPYLEKILKGAGNG